MENMSTQAHMTAHTMQPSSSGPTFVQWANEWKQLPASEKAKYQQTAEEQRQNLSTSVGTQKFIRHHLKLISQSCEALNDMGVNIGGLFTDSTRCVGVFGNTRAYQFFQTVELKDQFVSNMMDTQTNLLPAVDEVKKKYVSQMRQIFNDCWAKVTGKNQVPYKSIKDNMYQVEVKNLPNAVKFRDPSCMGLPTLKKIIAARDSLEFSITRRNKVATITTSDEPCRLNQDQVEIPNSIPDSLEDGRNQTAFVPNPDHDDVPNVMQESLEDEGKQTALVPNPVEAELFMDVTDSEDTNSVLEIMEPSRFEWFEVEKILKTKIKEKANNISLSGRDMRSQHGNQNIILENPQNCNKMINIIKIHVLYSKTCLERPLLCETDRLQRPLSQCTNLVII